MDNDVYLHREYKKFSSNDDLSKPLSFYQAEVHSDWIDYNGHMSESFYLYAFGDASDALFRHIGIDEDYRSCLLYTSPSPRDAPLSRMPSSA